MKLCVLFPGIGYHCDKPLLYYSGKLARSMGYEVIPLRYDGFDISAKGNREKMAAAAEHAYSLTESQLADVDFSAYQRVVFIGKSIGTAACLRYREQYAKDASAVLLTPLAMTFAFSAKGCIALHGTADPWADTDELARLCSEAEVPLYKYPKANHSLETGEVMTDLGYLRQALTLVQECLR